MTKFKYCEVILSLLLFNKFLLNNTYHLTDDEFCDLITDETSISVKGIRSVKDLIGPVDSNRGELLVVLNETLHIGFSIQLMDYDGLIRPYDTEISHSNLRADAVYSFNTSVTLQHALIHGLSVRIQTRLNHKTTSISKTLLKNYNRTFSGIQAAAHLPPFTVLIVKNNETFTQVILDNKNEIVSTIDYADEKPPTMIAFLSLIRSQYIVLACFAIEEKVRQVCALYSFEIASQQALFTFNNNTYHSNIKRILGCPLTETEFCDDPKLDAAYGDSSSQYLVQGRHTYLLNEGKLTHFVSQPTNIYKQAAYQCHNSTDCYFSDAKVYCGGNYMGSQGDLFNINNEETLEAAFCVGNSSHSQINLVYNEKIRNYNNSYVGRVQESFPGVPTYLDAVIVDDKTNQYIVFADDNYYTSSLHDYPTVGPVKQLITSCAKSVKHVDKRSRIPFIVIIVIMSVVVVIGLIVGVFLYVKNVERSKETSFTDISNRTPDPNANSTISGETVSDTV